MTGRERSTEIEELRDELESIHFQERASFGPELKAELGAEWARLEGGERATGAWLRYARRLVRRFGHWVDLMPPAARFRATLAVTLAAAGVVAAISLASRAPEPADLPWADFSWEDPIPFVEREDLTGPETEILLEEALRLVFPDTELGDASRQLLMGSRPAGLVGFGWRETLGQALARAAEESPDNAAPLLALARLRIKQGTWMAAAGLLERGLERVVEHPGRASSELMADVLSELGELALHGELANSTRGYLPASALDPDLCPEAPSSPAVGNRASSRSLVAWNYLCGAEFAGVMAASFRADTSGATTGEDHSRLAERYFQAAIETHPGHVEANVNSLLPLADGNWPRLLEGALGFVENSAGDPHAHLLAGLALQRLGQSAEAEVHLRAALEEMPASRARAMRDVRFLLEGTQVAEYLLLREEEREEWEAEFWRGLEPDHTTPVNEREIEHLARAGHVLLRFGDLTCDPAEVWIRYGRPSAVRVVADSGGLDTEFWDYGAGTNATFVRLGSGLPPVLTPEGRAYLDELRDVYPHRGVYSGEG